MNILNLPAFEILNIQENENDLSVYVNVIENEVFCTHCGVINEFYRFGFKNQLYMDLPIRNKRVGIFINRQRYRCKACNGTFFSPIDCIDDKRNATKRLIQYIEKESLKRTFVSIAEDVGLDEKTIRNIFNDYAKNLEKNYVFKTPEWLGIDEIHILNKPRCVITNVKECTALDMLRDRNKSTVIDYLRNISNKNIIEIVTMDMWNPYKDAVKFVLPKSKIIVDKFHFLRLANTAVEIVRKDLREGMTSKERRGLMHDRFVLLKRNKDLKFQERLFLELWTKQYKELAQVYNLKENLYEIWDSSMNKCVAMSEYEQWEKSVPESIKYAYQPLITAVDNWKEEIFNYFSHRATNAYTESLNNLIRVINRTGRGYSFDVLRTKLLFSEGIHKEKRPKFNKDSFVFGKTMDRFFLNESMYDYDTKNYGADISTICKKIEEGYFD